MAGVSRSARESRLEKRRAQWVQRRAPTEHVERERRAERFRPPVRDEGAQEGVAGALAQRRAAHEDRARHPPANKGAHRCRCPRVHSSLLPIAHTRSDPVHRASSSSRSHLSLCFALL